MNYVLWGIIILLTVWLAYAFYKRYKMLAGIGNTPDSDKLIILTDATFKKQISKGVSLVDFWADWCTPCKIQGPIVSQVAEEIGDEAKICKLDVQNNQRTAKELNIRNIPTIIMFKDGKVFKQFVGVKPKPVLVKGIREALG